VVLDFFKEKDDLDLAFVWSKFESVRNEVQQDLEISSLIAKEGDEEFLRLLILGLSCRRDIAPLLLAELSCDLGTLLVNERECDILLGGEEAHDLEGLEDSFVEVEVLLV